MTLSRPSAAVLLLLLSVTTGCGGEEQASAAPAPNLCGNGEVDPGEECDDGNREEGDQCSAACTRGMLGVDVAIRTCPRIAALSVVPGQIPPGEAARVKVEVDDPDGDAVGIRWLAATGEFLDPTMAVTEYRCAGPGGPVLAVSVHDGLCGETETITVTCL